MFFFWILAPCRLVGGCGAKTQKTKVIILTAVETSNLT
jgi:hypothetical protein